MSISILKVIECTIYVNVFQQGIGLHGNWIASNLIRLHQMVTR